MKRNILELEGPVYYGTGGDVGWGRECDNPKIEDITTGARFDADGR